MLSDMLCLTYIGTNSLHQSILVLPVNQIFFIIVNFLRSVWKELFFKFEILKICRFNETNLLKPLTNKLIFKHHDHNITND